MKILAIETSAGPASCAVTENGEILASAVVNTRLTHSQTLLPMVDAMLKNAALSLEDMDVLAVSAGPGSFTGVRIGVAAVKGLAFTSKIPCARVSTLAAMAHNADGLPFDGIVCAVMDARCRQVYTADFLCEGGKVIRLTPDEAISIDDLKIRLNSYKKMIFLVGDGANLCYTSLKEFVPNLILAPPALRFQQATGVAAVAAVLAENGQCIDAAALLPVYLRLPQAERELKQRQQAR